MPRARRSEERADGVGRAASLIFYWDRGRLVAHNYRTRRRMVVDPQLVPFLHGFTPSRAPRRTTAALLRHTLLEPSGRADRAAGVGWDDWGPLAAAFHFGTKDVSWSTDPRAGERLLARKAEQRPAPAPLKPAAPGARTVALPAVNRSGELVATLLDRRTWRDFGRKPVALRDIATLLHLTWGVQRRGVAPGQGSVVLKTSPSGGACHPGEVYLLAVRVSGLERGLYHYQADRQTLSLIRRGAGPADIGRYIPGQPWYRPAAALFLMTAVFARAQWRYATPRAYRSVLVDAGHLCQTFCLVASWLRLAPFCSMALADSAIERDLGVDGVAEGILYAAGVGSRPAGGWQPGIPGLRRG